jgi:elongator complex protein 3
MMFDKVKVNSDKVEILTRKYLASEGEEVFISAEDVENDVLIGYLRLRIPSEKAHRQEVKAKPCSIVRELHVYGPLVPVGERLARAWQHRGFGGVLLGEAERISREEFGLEKVLVLSGLGVREYFGRFGYVCDGVYMEKRLKG